jgi:hypothetical protein
VQKKTRDGTIVSADTPAWFQIPGVTVNKLSQQQLQGLVQWKAPIPKNHTDPKLLDQFFGVNKRPLDPLLTPSSPSPHAHPKEPYRPQAAGSLPRGKATCHKKLNNGRFGVFSLPGVVRNLKPTHSLPISQASQCPTQNFQQQLVGTLHKPWRLFLSKATCLKHLIQKNLFIGWLGILTPISFQFLVGLNL